MTGTLSPIQRKGPQGKEERKIYTVSTSLLYVEIYSLTQCKADLEPRAPQLLTGQSVVYKAGWCFEREVGPESAAGDSLNLSLSKFMIVTIILRGDISTSSNLARTCDFRYLKITTNGHADPDKNLASIYKSVPTLSLHANTKKWHFELGIE